jgi:flap endonuclease-1
MGIKNLSIILNQKCGCAINERNLTSYSGMVIGIDVSIFLYKYLYNNDDHIEGLTRFILRLYKNNIVPVFIFDGKPPKEKSDVLLERKEKREFLIAKKNILEYCIKKDIIQTSEEYDSFRINLINLAKNQKNVYIITEDEIKDYYTKSIDDLKADLEKVTKKIIRVSSLHIESAKKLFDLFGVSYIVSPTEAECLLAVLCKENYVDACISEDMDILANGGDLFLRNFNADKNFVDEYCLEGILNTLELTNDQFIDMCILCGSDYTDKINGMGPITALKMIKKYNNLENVIDQFNINKKFEVPNKFDYNKARDLFKNPIDISLIKDMKKMIKIGKPNVEGIKDFLKNTKIKDKYIAEISNSLFIYYLSILNIFKRK